MKDDGKSWLAAEIKALEDQGTWVLQPLPPGKRRCVVNGCMHINMMSKESCKE